MNCTRLSRWKPAFSVVVAVYNDWQPLGECLSSLVQQSCAADFEVIVIDDGSRMFTPDYIQEWERYLPLTIARQPHSGIAAARNRGVNLARGSVVLFVDADCKLEEDCLTELMSVVAQSLDQTCFQLRLIGDCETAVGRAETLRLMTIQRHHLQTDGHIRYLNTAGFAIRRDSIDRNQPLFDEATPRGEDTLLLASLIAKGEPPLFVENAVVKHAIPLSLAQCLGKDIRSAYLEHRAFHMIHSGGVRIRMSNRERLKMLAAMWRESGNRSIGKAAWLTLVLRQSVQRLVSAACGFFCLEANA